MRLTYPQNHFMIRNSISSCFKDGICSYYLDFTNRIIWTISMLAVCILWQDTFHNCITKRISLLLTRGMVRLVVIDSIAALFRCEFGVSDSVRKARYLQMFGAQLHNLSTRFRTPIMCINQVWHQHCFSFHRDHLINGWGRQNLCMQVSWCCI